MKTQRKRFLIYSVKNSNDGPTDPRELTWERIRPKPEAEVSA